MNRNYLNLLITMLLHIAERGATLIQPTSRCVVEFAKSGSWAKRFDQHSLYHGLLLVIILPTFLNLCFLLKIAFDIQEAVEHAQATGHVNFQEFK